MSYCSRCGVEVEDQVKNCPLCEAPIYHIGPATTPGVWKNPEEDKLSRVFPTSVDVKNRIYLLLTTLLIMASLILWAIDYSEEGSLTWSWIPTSTLLASFLYLTSFFMLYRKFLRLATSLMGSTVFLLATLNYLTSSQWFFTLGLPILLCFQGVFTLCYLGIRTSRVRGYNIFGIILAGAAIVCLGTDGLIHLYQGHWDLSWSIITSFSLFPFSLYFFFLHYGLHKILDITRTFHF